jgi:type III secretion protein S
MNYATLTQTIYAFFSTGFLIVAPPMALAIAAGLILAILQAATQIQEQSLPALVKVVVIMTVLAMMGVPLATPFFEQTRSVFSSFYAMSP